MTETVYSKAAIDGIVGDLVETHSLMFGMIVGTNLKAGVWTEEEARFRLEEMMDIAKSVIAKAVIGGTLKQVETMSGPFLEVIDGGKKD